MRILIFGAGGVGSVLGAFLARAGHDVSLVGRAAHMDAIKKRGLKVSGSWGSFCTKAFDLYTAMSEISESDSRFDIIFLTVKSHDTAKAVEALLPYIKEGVTLASFQNGVGNVEKKPGEVTVTMTTDAIAVTVNTIPGIKTNGSPNEIAKLLNEAGIAARAASN